MKNETTSKYNYAEVLIDAFTDLENQAFTYAIPDYMKAYVNLGTPVIVPFRENYLGGYIIELHETSPLPESIKIKDIISASYEQIFNQEYIELLKWVAEYYHTSFLSVLKAAVPSGILTKMHKEIELIIEEEEFQDFIALQNKGEFKEFCEFIIREQISKFSVLKSNFGSKCSKYIRKLEEVNYIRTNFLFETKSKYKKQLAVTYINSELAFSTREKEVLNFLKREKGYILLQEVIKLAKTSEKFLKKLQDKGCIDISKQIVLRKPQKNIQEGTNNLKLELNKDQQNALEEFEKIQAEEKKDKIILLHGITGSGKTEIYLQTIEKVLEQGKSAIVLVPEISLTPQTVRRFRERFGSIIAILHSALSDGERFDEWARIKNNLAKIIIGARSAIFAPCNDLGLIIIDEEHEGSYKQERNPRYNAKDVAFKRAELNNATIILGSATPSTESYYNAVTNPKYKLIELPERVGSTVLPPVVLVDMRQEFLQGNKGIFSRQLHQAIADRLEKKEQSMIFINRRGFSTFVLCRDCGYVVKCGDCSVSMVYHATPEYLKCHYCGKQEPLPTKCPKCKCFNIRHFGIGTQKIESITQKIFPNARIARLDRDTTTKKDSHQTVLDKFSKGEYDILIGTQMIAKGLDFPNVTLVGIITADTALNIPDFRASEKTFQLITQVAGRAGRGEVKGEVIAQAYSLDHISIQTSSKHDFKTFYNAEIQEREALSYPPFSNLINIIIANTNEEEVRTIAKELGKFLKDNKTENILSVLGPVPAGIPKIQNFYRFQILIKTKVLQEARDLLKKVFKEIKINSNTKIGIDIDPLNML